MRAWIAVAVLSTALAGMPAAAQEPEHVTTQARVPFGELPSVAVALDGFMWVLDRRGNTIGQIDPTTNEVVDEIDLDPYFGARPAVWDLDAARGSLWLTVPSKGRLLEIDPATSEVISAPRVRGHVTDLYFARGSLWFTGGTQRRTVLVRMDPASGKATARFRLGGTNTGVTDVVAYDGSVWVVRRHSRHVAGRGRNPTFYVTAALWRIDPRSDRVRRKEPLGATFTRGAVNPVIGDVEVVAEGLWMSRVHEKRVVLVNPRTTRVLDEESLAAFALPWEIEVLRDELWVGNLNRAQVARIDPATNERSVVDVGGSTSDLATGFGSVWAAFPGSQEQGEVVRLTPE